MRITNGVMVDNMMKHLQDNTKKLDKLNQQLSSGKKFQLPSEDPIGVANSMELNELLNNNEQYQKNVDQSKDWLNATENSLDNGNEILQRSRELAVYGANESLSDTDRQALAREVDELHKELINIANTQLGDRYIFSGQKTSTKPYEDNNTDKLNYEGDQKSITREIAPGVNMKINVNAKEVFEDGIENIAKLKDALEDDETEEIDRLIGEIDEVLNDNHKERAEIGAKVNRLELTENSLEDQNLQTQEILSENEDVDIAEKITDLKMQESVYRASLAVGARIMQPTLVDFLQ